MTIRNTGLNIAAAAAANIAASQSPGAGAITLTASPVVLDAPRRVIVTSGGTDTGIAFTITGTNRYGATLSETMAGAAAGAASTTQDFKTVTSVTHTGSVATTVTVGTSSTASTEWVGLNTNAVVMTPIGVAVAISGTINYTVEYTYDINPPTGYPVPYSISAGPLTAKTANGEAGNTFNFPIAALRLTQNSGTAPCSARMTIIQQGPTS
jgi:hypothetical protein